MRILIIGGTSTLALSIRPSLEKIGEVLTAGRKDCDINIDLGKEIDIEKFPKSIDVVLHAAAHFGGDQYNEVEQAVNINVLGTLKACEIANRLHVKHFILISSIFVCLDKKSDYYSIYALTKKQSEEIAQFYCLSNNIKLSVLRPTQIYGNSGSFVKHQPFFYHIVKKAKQGENIYIYGSLLQVKQI